MVETLRKYNKFLSDAGFKEKNDYWSQVEIWATPRPHRGKNMEPASRAESSNSYICLVLELYLLSPIFAWLSSLVTHRWKLKRHVSHLYTQPPPTHNCWSKGMSSALWSWRVKNRQIRPLKTGTMTKLGELMSIALEHKFIKKISFPRTHLKKKRFLILIWSFNIFKNNSASIYKITKVTALQTSNYSSRTSLLSDRNC